MSLKFVLLMCIVAVASAKQSQKLRESVAEFGAVDLPNMFEENLADEFDSRMLQTSMSTSTSSTVTPPATVSETSTVSTPTTSTPVVPVVPVIPTTTVSTPTDTTVTTTTSDATASGQLVVTPQAVPNVAASAASTSGGANAGVIAGAVVGAVAAIVGAGYLVYRRKQQENEESPADEAV